ncbi:MAG: glycosyltransferase [Verrucomicrobiota bacterium]|nr:glycosyltransferase [Verrucomicrobiota bacterium]
MLRKKLARFQPEAVRGLREVVYWNSKFLWRNLRAAARWLGQKPRVYLHAQWQLDTNPIWQTYRITPPLRYAPYPIAELCHWISGSYPLPLPRHKRHIVEAEHMLVIAEQFRRGHGGPARPMADWFIVHEERENIRRLVDQPNWRKIITFSAGLVEHFKLHLAEELWPKLDFVHPAFPAQRQSADRPERPFTVLVIASRFSDKGVPEVFRAMDVLRERHGRNVQLLLVSQAIPKGQPLPAGTIHHDVPIMSPELKREVYESSDVLLLPNFAETVACFPEAYAFGLPVITTRIHHGAEFVCEGETGFLLETPIFAFNEKLGREWRTAEDFVEELAARRGRGELENIVEEAVEYLSRMIDGRMDLQRMRDAARKFHREHFDPEVRNGRLRDLYTSAIRN